MRQSEDWLSESSLQLEASWMQ